MRSVARSKIGRALCAAACTLSLVAVPIGATAQTIEITDVVEAREGVITVYTPGGVPPEQKLIEVQARTTGTILFAAMAINGQLLGDQWQGDVFNLLLDQGGGDWAGLIDLGAEGGFTPNQQNIFTLRAFAFSNSTSGYDASAQTRAVISGFSDSDSLDFTFDIRDSTTVDPDGNGLPGASALTSIAPNNQGPADFLVTPDPADPNDPNDPDFPGAYKSERRVQSIDQGSSPTFIIVNKQMLVNFQIYEIAISTPNLAWFKSNFGSEPAVTAASNAVIVLRSEPVGRFIVDNFPENPSTNPTLSPSVDIVGEFGGGNVPFAFLSVTIMLETSAGTWVEIPGLANTAPLFIQVSSIQMNDGSNFQVHEYATSGEQSLFDVEDMFILGDGSGWAQVDPSRIVGPDFNGATTSISFTESVESSIYGIYFRRSGSGGGNDGGGGGGGGCFVATAAYGTPMAQEIDALRSVRDEHLLNTVLGSAFVDTYYRLSPALADVIAESPVLRAVSRAVLTPVVVMAQSARSAGLFGGLALATMLAFGASRRRVRNQRVENR